MIEIIDLHKSFGEHKVLTGINRICRDMTGESNGAFRNRP